MINPTIKRTIVAFPFKVQFIAFSLYYFFNCKRFLFFFNFFVLFYFKRSKNVFIIQMTVFRFLNHKNFFRPIWSVNFCKSAFIFLYSYMITNMNLESSLLSFLLKPYMYLFYINKPHFNCAMICIVFINYII